MTDQTPAPVRLSARTEELLTGADPALRASVIDAVAIAAAAAARVEEARGE